MKFMKLSIKSMFHKFISNADLCFDGARKICTSVVLVFHAYNLCKQIGP